MQNNYLRTLSETVLTGPTVLGELETLAKEYSEASPYIRRAIGEFGEAWVFKHYFEQFYPLLQAKNVSIDRWSPTSA